MAQLDARRIAIFVYVAAGATALAMLVSLGMAINAKKDLEDAYERRYQSYLLADELRQSSDDLTRFVRSYTVTGDSRYREYYWKVLGIRNGELPRPESYEGIYWDFAAASGHKLPADGPAVSLRARMYRVGFTEAEFALLDAAQRESEDLVSAEREAMAATTLEGASLKVALPMHSAEYHAKKARIMAPIAKFYQMTLARTQASIAAAHATLNWWVGMCSGSFLILLLCCGWVWWLMMHRVWFPDAIEFKGNLL